MKHPVARPAWSGKLRLNARLVREKDRARARELRTLVLYGAAIVVPLLAYVWQRVDFIRMSYKVEALSRQRQDLQEMNKELRVECSLLLAPDRIEQMARRQLGLVEPAPADVRRVEVIDGRVNEIGGAQAREGGAAGDDAAPRSGRGALPGAGETESLATASAGALPLTRSLSGESR